MYVVMEYMCHGDLLGFLRASRGHHGMYHISPGTRYQPPTLNLCSRDLLNVATKIANGMRYLSDRKVTSYCACFHVVRIHHYCCAFRSYIVHCVLRMFWLDLEWTSRFIMLGLLTSRLKLGIIL